jgi:hypothetical protein
MVRDSGERRLQGSRPFSCSYTVMVRDGALYDFLVMERWLQQLLVDACGTLPFSQYTDLT